MYNVQGIKSFINLTYKYLHHIKFTHHFRYILDLWVIYNFPQSMIKPLSLRRLAIFVLELVIGQDILFTKKGTVMYKYKARYMIKG